MTGILNAGGNTNQQSLAPASPRSIINPGKYFFPDSTRRTLRNNNPTAQSLYGYDGKIIQWDGLSANQTDVQLASEHSPMSQFDNPLYGIRAAARTFRKNQSEGVKTIRALVQRHLGSDKPTTHAKNLMSMVSKYTGVAADAPIDLADDGVMEDFLTGFIKHEGGLNKSELSEVLSMVSAGVMMEHQQEAQQPKQIAQKPNNEIGFNYQAPAFGTSPNLFNNQFNQDLAQQDELVVGRPTGEVTDEGGVGKGRKLYYNNFGGKSSEYSIGVRHPKINNNQLTHIPSIYGGKRRSEKYAIDQIIKNNGKDPETGRFITHGGDPKTRSQGLTYSQIPLAQKPNGKFNTKGVVGAPLPHLKPKGLGLG